MTLTAREAMQALLDGKMLRKDEVTIIPTEWGFQMQADDGAYKDIILRDCEICKEYPLTFEQALRAMLDGKIVESDLNPNLKQRFYDGCFKYNGDDAEWRDSYFPLVEQKAKWKVVE